ncbi:MAG: hypothetical protein PVH13_01105 [Gammaproteobacteria bacterium]|jgi:hypothetical protein
MSEKDETATVVLDEEIVDEILQDEKGVRKDKGRLVRIDRDNEAGRSRSPDDPEEED